MVLGTRPGGFEYQTSVEHQLGPQFWEQESDLMDPKRECKDLAILGSLVNLLLYDDHRIVFGWN